MRCRTIVNPAFSVPVALLCLIAAGCSIPVREIEPPTIRTANNLDVSFDPRYAYGDGKIFHRGMGAEEVHWRFLGPPDRVYKEKCRHSLEESCVVEVFGFMGFMQWWHVGYGVKDSYHYVAVKIHYDQAGKLADYVVTNEQI